MTAIYLNILSIICLYFSGNSFHMPDLEDLDVNDYVNMYDAWVSKLNFLKCTIHSSGNLIEDYQNTLATDLYESQGKILARIRYKNTNEGVYIDDKIFRRVIYSSQIEEIKAILDTVKPMYHKHLRHSYHILTLRNFFDNDGNAAKLTDLINRKIYSINNISRSNTIDITFSSSTGDHIVSLRKDLNYAADKVIHVNKNSKIKSITTAKKWTEAAKGLYLPTTISWEIEINGSINKRSLIDIKYHECNIPFNISSKDLKYFHNCKVHDLINMKCYVADENGNYVGECKLANGTKLTLSRAHTDDTIIKKKSSFEFASNPFLYIISGVLIVLVGALAARWYRGKYFLIFSMLCLSAVSCGVPPHAKIKCPEKLYINNAEIGRRIRTSFYIENDGNVPLEIFNIRTNCPCNGFEILKDDKLERVEALTILPGGKQEVTINYGVAGRPGTDAVFGIFFLTNDKNSPEHHILLHVAKLNGGISISPDVVNYGNVATNVTHSVKLSIADAHPVKRRLVKCELIPPSNKIKIDEPSAATDGYHVTIQAYSEEPFVLSESTIVLYFDDQEPPRKVQLIANFVAPVTLSANRIVLPLKTDKGIEYKTSLSVNMTDSVIITDVLPKRIENNLVSIKACTDISGARDITIEVNKDQYELLIKSIKMTIDVDVQYKDEYLPAPKRTTLKLQLLLLGKDSQ